MQIPSSDTQKLQSPTPNRQLLDVLEVSLKMTEWTDWAKMPCWTADEAAALTLGLSPQSIRRYPEVNHPLIDRFNRVKKMVARACATNDIVNSEHGIAPDDYLAWATRYGFDVPAELAAEVTRIKSFIPKRPSDKPLGSRERDTLLKMILGLAMSGHAYNPAADKSPIIKDISDDLERVGLALDLETIRRKLKEAAAVHADELSQVA